MNFELELIEWLQSFRTPFLDNLFQFFTMFGEELIIVGVLGLLYWCYDKKIGEYVGLSVFVSLILNSGIKVLTARLRPFQVDSNITNVRPSTSDGYSFPSGHTQGAASVFYSLAEWIRRRWLFVFSWIIIVLVAISRMYLGVHYLSDVIVGGALGIGISIGFAKYFKSNPDTTRFYRVMFYVVTVFFIGVFAVNLLLAKSTVEMTDAEVLYLNTEGISKMVGLFFGFMLGVQFEKKHVQFEQHRNLWKNVLRLVLGVAFVMGARLGLKIVFTWIVDSEALLQGQIFASVVAILLDGVRYFAMSYLGIGIAPLVFKKVKI